MGRDASRTVSRKVTELPPAVARTRTMPGRVPATSAGPVVALPYASEVSTAGEPPAKSVPVPSVSTISKVTRRPAAASPPRVTWTESAPNSPPVCCRCPSPPTRTMASGSGRASRLSRSTRPPLSVSVTYTSCPETWMSCRLPIPETTFALRPVARSIRQIPPEAVFSTTNASFPGVQQSPPVEPRPSATVVTAPEDTLTRNRRPLLSSSVTYSSSVP
ncbi:hypothetical protein [Streptomyces clavuligerus]|uniref:hypothetical protein n=1 Tax=Streptomyces clavuligerus TaxID=1901 RepID=UPI001E603AE2|nr:hypothetical protein [Streptomyces clavuligerus]